MATQPVEPKIQAVIDTMNRWVCYACKPINKHRRNIALKEENFHDFAEKVASDVGRKKKAKTYFSEKELIALSRLAFDTTLRGSILIFRDPMGQCDMMTLTDFRARAGLFILIAINFGEEKAIDLFETLEVCMKFPLPPPRDDHVFRKRALCGLIQLQSFRIHEKHDEERIIDMVHKGLGYPFLKEPFPNALPLSI